MARARNIKPGTPRNERLAKLDPLYRLGWIYSWMFADCNGVIEYRPERLKVDIFPYDEINVEAFVAACARSGFFVLYQTQDRCFIQITKFVKHQNPHKQERAAGSDLPEYTSPEVTLIQSVDSLRNYFRTASELNVLIPDSLFLIPDSLTADAGMCVNSESDEEAVYRETILDGLRAELKLNILPRESDWLNEIEIAYKNKIPATEFLECLAIIRQQTWRTGAVKPAHVSENLPNLPKLRSEDRRRPTTSPKRRDASDYDREVLESMEADRAAARS